MTHAIINNEEAPKKNERVDLTMTLLEEWEFQPTTVIVVGCKNRKVCKIRSEIGHLATTKAKRRCVTKLKLRKKLFSNQ